MSTSKKAATPAAKPPTEKIIDTSALVFVPQQDLADLIPAKALIPIEIISQDLVRAVEATANECEAMTIADQNTYAAAGEMMKAIHSLGKKVEQRTEEKKGPAYRMYMAIQKAGKQLQEPLTAAKTALSRKMGTYQAAQERLAAEARQKAAQRLEEERKAREAAAKLAEEQRVMDALDKGELPPDDVIEPEPQPEEVAPMVFTPPPAKVAGTRTVTTIHHEVVDQAAVPDEYFRKVLDEDRIKADIKSGRLRPVDDGPTTVNGIRLWIERKVVSSGR